VLLVPTLVRAFYAVRCQFDGNQFNHVYFGSDSKCPMNKLNLMCLVLEKNPDPTPKITGVDEIEIETREEVEMGTQKNPDPTPKITGVDEIEIETREEVEMGTQD
jgi:hypothetical protein